MAETLSDILSFHSAQALHPFPGLKGQNNEQPRARLKLQFSIQRRRSGFEFSFHLAGASAGDLQQLVFPEELAHGQRKRRNELWKNTCLEVFFAAADKPSYFELNLSPSGDWNLYTFAAYRSGMREVQHSLVPRLSCQWTPDKESVAWHGSLLVGEQDSNNELGELFKATSLVMGATAVLEYASGEREYWALTHAGEKPDFHLRESFRLVL